MGHLLFVLYIVLGFSTINPEPSKAKVPVSLNLITVISDSEEAFLGRFGGATITENGEILYSDKDQKMIHIFHQDGKYHSSFGRQGRGPGEFEVPSAIKTDDEGYIYIIDNRNARISVWSLDYEYFTDIKMIPGWNIHFKKNARGLYVFNKPFRRMPSGNDTIIISKINRNDRNIEQLYVYEIVDWFDEDRPFSTFSNWVITSEDVLIATGHIDQYQLRRISMYGNIESVFGSSREPIHYTEEEMKIRVEIANNISSEAARIIAQGRTYKHMYSNIEICSQNWLWVHRNKKFGERDEIDIYNLDGEYKTMVTIPPSDNELQMLGIYSDKILFHITTPIGEERLYVYQIEYSGE